MNGQTYPRPSAGAGGPDPLAPGVRAERDAGDRRPEIQPERGQPLQPRPGHPALTPGGEAARAVNKPTRSFILPGEGLLLVESTN